MPIAKPLFKGLLICVDPLRYLYYSGSISKAGKSRLPLVLAALVARQTNSGIRLDQRHVNLSNHRTHVVLNHALIQLRPLDTQILHDLLVLGGGRTIIDESAEIFATKVSIICGIEDELVPHFAKVVQCNRNHHSVIRGMA